MTVTYQADGVEPYLVYDRFLQREQIRVMTHIEYLQLLGGEILLKHYEAKDGMKANLICVNHRLWTLVPPQYGSEGLR